MSQKINENQICPTFSANLSRIHPFRQWGYFRTILLPEKTMVTFCVNKFLRWGHKNNFLDFDICIIFCVRRKIKQWPRTVTASTCAEWEKNSPKSANLPRLKHLTLVGQLFSIWGHWWLRIWHGISNGHGSNPLCNNNWYLSDNQPDFGHYYNGRWLKRTLRVQRVVSSRFTLILV